VEMKFPDTLIKAQGKFRRNWDFLIIALSIYQAIVIPFNLSFTPDEVNSPFFKTCDSIIDIIFMVDIVFRFRTSYIDPISGEEVLDSFLIARRYVTGMSFYFDVISTVPFDDWFGDSASSSGSPLQFLGLFKIGRIVRISNVIMNLNTSQEYKALMKVFYLIFCMFLYIHMTGCIWNFIVSLEELWIPNMDFIWFGTPQIYDYYYAPTEKRLLICLYIGFYLFGVGEVCPRTQGEIMIAVPILILSSIVNGLIIGNMALYISELKKKRADFQNKMDTVNTAINNLNLTENLKREV
jgi:hypothetical protein